MMLQKMMFWILGEVVFDKVAAHVQVIDCQKRVLPHAHCIVFLDKKMKDKLNVFE